MNMYESYGHVVFCNMDELQHFSENDLLTLVTPNEPRLTLDSITLVEGLKLMNMYESYDHAV